eukprot:2857569-Amphidinium_carterae.1
MALPKTVAKTHAIYLPGQSAYKALRIYFLFLKREVEFFRIVLQRAPASHSGASDTSLPSIALRLQELCSTRILQLWMLAAHALG